MIRATSVALTFALSIVLTRVLPPEEYGFYTYYVSIAAIAVIPMMLGFPGLLVREIAQYHQQNKWSYIEGIWAVAKTSLLGLSALCLCGIAFALELIPHGLSPKEKLAIYLVILPLPLSVYISIAGAYLRGLNQTGKSLILETIVGRAIMLGVCLLAFLAMRYSANVIMILSFQGISIFIAFASMLVFKNFFDSHNRRVYKRDFEIARWSKSAFYLMSVSSIDIATQHVDVLMLGYWADLESVAYYKVAAMAGMILTIALTAVNSAIDPKIAKLIQTKDIDEINRFIRKNYSGVAILAILTVVLFLFFGGEFLALAFGEIYINSHLVLVIISFGHLISVLLGPAVVILYLSKKEHILLHCYFIALIINIGGGYLLIPIYGAIGAAFSTAFSLALANIYLWHQCLKQTGVNSFVLAPMRPPKD